MNKLDAMHRAFKDYRKVTEERNCSLERKAIRKTDEKLDYFKVKKYVCIIEEDWIKAIEDGLVFVEKAIAEERQFIRVNGETVPIEKARKISRDSVVHLAKHSQLISRLPEDPKDTLVPDEIYIVEKLSDYAVYENRFLYMLLIQLQEFIYMRLDKIKKLRMTYICDYGVTKDIKGKYRSFTYKEEFHEERFDNPYPIADEKCQELVNRIENIGICVNAYLKTTLMTEVAKAPMVKPPITKTNVLKMNNNFKNALALYDYICAYKKEGYVATEIEKNFLPLTDLQSDELSEIVMLSSFLTYKYGNEIEDLLEIEYEKEEERRRLLEAEKLKEKIARLKKKVIESGMGVEEYMLALEERNKQLEKDSNDLILAKKEIEELNQKIDDLNKEIIEYKRRIEELENIIEEKNKEIAYLNQKYIDDMNELKKNHAIEIANLMHEYEEKIDLMDRNYQDQIASLNEEHENRIHDLEIEQEAELERIASEIAKEYQDTILNHQEEIRSLKAEIEEYNQQVYDMKLQVERKTVELEEEIKNAELTAKNALFEFETKARNYQETCDQIVNKKNQEIDQLKREKTMITAEYNAIRVQTGKLAVSDDFTTKDRFDELEREFEAFNQFFKAEWKRTKKSIRKKLLWTKEEKSALAQNPDFKAEPKDPYEDEKKSS